MVIAIITETKALELQGTEFSEGMNFNPIQLSDNRWFISLVEAQYLKAEDIYNFEDYVYQDENND